MAYERFIDRAENKHLIKNCLDFKLRRHGMPPSWMIYFFIGMLLLNIILINELCVSIIMLDETQPPPTMKILITLITVSLLTTGAAVFSYAMVHKIRDIVIQTEFLNLLFSSSMSVNTEFLAIVNKEKSILHFDYHFDHIFIAGADELASFSMIEAHDGFDNEAREKMKEAVTNNTATEVAFVLPKEDEGTQNFIVKIEPLRRPNGFSVIRAYKA